MLSYYSLMTLKEGSMQRLLLLAGLAIALVACGPAAQPPSGAGSSDGGPKRGGVLNLHMPVDPNDWDVTLTGKSFGNGQNGHNLASVGLVSYKRGPDLPYNSAELVPELAERWEISPDAKSFTFHLRKGVKWPDLPPVNGRDLTSADVKFTYEYSSRTGIGKDLKIAPATYGAYFEGIDRIDTPDPNTAVVRFKEAFPPFIYYAASGWNPIFAKEIFDRDGNFSNQILGMGPWQLDMAASQKNTRYVWKKNPNFYDPNLPYIDEVRNLIITDSATQIAAFQTKQSDLLHHQLGVREYQELLQKVPTAVSHETYNSVADWRLYMNIRKTPLDDIRVRKALTMAIDRDNFLKTLGEGKYKLSFEGVQPGLFSDEEIKKMLPFNQAEAKRLLAEAGYANGVEIEMTFPGNDYGEIYRSGLQLFQAQLKQVGLNVNLKAEDKNDWNAKRRAGEYTLGLQQNNSVEADMDSFLFASWYSKSRNNYNQIRDPKLDTMVENQRKEGDPTKRRAMLREVVTYSLDNTYTVPIGNIAKFIILQPYVKGWGDTEYIKGSRWTDSWLDK